MLKFQANFISGCQFTNYIRIYTMHALYIYISSIVCQIWSKFIANPSYKLTRCQENGILFKVWQCYVIIVNFHIVCFINLTLLFYYSIERCSVDADSRTITKAIAGRCTFIRKSVTFNNGVIVAFVPINTSYLRISILFKIETKRETNDKHIN